MVRREHRRKGHTVRHTTNSHSAVDNFMDGEPGRPAASRLAPHVNSGRELPGSLRWGSSLHSQVQSVGDGDETKSGSPSPGIGL